MARTHRLMTPTGLEDSVSRLQPHALIDCGRGHARSAYGADVVRTVWRHDSQRYELRPLRPGTQRGRSLIMDLNNLDERPRSTQAKGTHVAPEHCS